MLSAKRIILTAVIMLSVTFGWHNASAAGIDPVRDAAATISGQDMLYVIGELASPVYEGRLTGQRGQIMAAEFIAGKFAKMGLIPLGDDGGYFQYFHVPTNVITSEPELKLILGDRTISYEIGEQYLFRGYTGSGYVTAPVCFAGYGITDEYLGYDDYAGIDASGKWVFCLRGWHPAFPEASFDWAYTGWKARNAVAHGAAGLLLVSAGSGGSVDIPIGSYLYGLPADEMHANFPMVHVGMDFAKDLFGHFGWYLPGIIEALDKGQPNAFDFPPDIQVQVAVEADFKPNATTANVIAFLPGSDPELASHAVVVCAHHDHVGHQDGVIFPGANDNASGVSALIAIAGVASRFAQPSRSIIFISFAGEEMGLLGSRHFVEHPTWPLDNIDYVINMDMLGQGSTLLVWGGTDFPRMRALFGRLGGEYGIEIENLPAYPVSDHGPFVDHGIEGVMLLAGGEREHDTAHKPYVYNPVIIDVDLLESIVRMTFVAIYELAG
jgi:hypothetical protein